MRKPPRISPLCTPLSGASDASQSFCIVKEVYIIHHRIIECYASACGDLHQFQICGMEDRLHLADKELGNVSNCDSFEFQGCNTDCFDRVFQI